jgi:hypothetical protein
MTRRSLAPGWPLSVCVFVLGYPAVFTLIAFTSGDSGMPLAQAVSSLPLMVVLATFFMFFTMGPGPALASYFIGLVIGTIYFAAFAVIEGTGSRFSNEPKPAVSAGAMLGAVLIVPAWWLHWLLAGGRESLGYGLQSLPFVILAGVALGSAAPLFTVARRHFLAQVGLHP